MVVDTRRFTGFRPEAIDFLAELAQNNEVLDRITNFFASRQRPMPESTKVQALVPAGAENERRRQTTGSLHLRRRQRERRRKHERSGDNPQLRRRIQR